MRDCRMCGAAWFGGIARMTRSYERRLRGFTAFRIEMEKASNRPDGVGAK